MHDAIIQKWKSTQKKLRQKMVGKLLRLVCVQQMPKSLIAGCSMKLESKEFMSLVKYAECVITNSFHGMIFTVQYCRPVYVFSREQCGTKITELLDLFGLSDHMLVTEAEKKNMSEINYEEVHSRIAEERKESLEFLNTELTSCV